jgi:Spy/CpxP family protein refolding chaperone
MTRLLKATTAALALTAAATISIGAQPPQGRGRGPAGPGPIPALRNLDLSDSQREQIRTIAQAGKESAGSPGAKLAALERQLHLAIFSDAAEAVKIDELKAAITAAHAEALTTRIDVETRIAQVLTPEQRAKARESLSKGRPFGGAPGGRGRRGAGLVR